MIKCPEKWDMISNVKSSDNLSHVVYYVPQLKPVISAFPKQHSTSHAFNQWTRVRWWMKRFSFKAKKAGGNVGLGSAHKVFDEMPLVRGAEKDVVLGVRQSAGFMGKENEVLVKQFKSGEEELREFNSLCCRIWSRLIIEDCSEVRFAPYCLGYSEINSDLKKSNLDAETGNWANVDDIKWLKAVNLRMGVEQSFGVGTKMVILATRLSQTLRLLALTAT
ncbi:hypothetical protein AgCh_009722 [Apium graveolens]